MTREGMEIGHYRLIRLLGAGSMGEVYLAQDTRISRSVAIKIVRDETSAYPQSSVEKDTARLFEREMRAITALDHPNILPLYDFGEEKVNGEALTYMVMPFRTEGSLADWLQRRNESGQHAPYEVVSIIHQAAGALYHAHTHDLMHLDVKPSNFLVRTREVNPNGPDLLLADFGISKFNTATMMASQSIRGTPIYMAPEQWSGVPVAATDQYALAIMAYQLVTGRAPFQGNMQQLMYQHLFVSPQPPSTFDVRIPYSVDMVLLRALAKKPEDRFPSILDYAGAFEQAWQNEGSDGSATYLPEQATFLPTQRVTPQAQIPPLFPPTVNVSGKAESPSQKRMNNRTLPVLIVLFIVVGIGGFGFLLSRFFTPSSASHVPGVQVSQVSHAASPTVAAKATLSLTATSGSIPHLKSFYNGTAWGYLNAYVTFTLESEDNQGNIVMATTFQQAADPQKLARYFCHGFVSSNQHLHLDCTSSADAHYLLTVDATIYPDGHMQGIEIATVTDDPNYYHFYNWSAS